MIRYLFIILAFAAMPIAKAQTTTFEKEVNNLFFGVDLTKASGFLVDTFLKISDLHHSSRVVRQSSLGTGIQLPTDKQAWSDRHVFTFTKSPLKDLKIKSGTIEVKIAESNNSKRLLDLQWSMDFDKKSDADIYFGQLQTIFQPLSTKQKKEMNDIVGEIVQYSTRKAADKGIKDISFVLGLSPQSKRYMISLLLMNEFMTD